MKVLGPIVNGDNMMIGANAVMIKDAPFGSVQGVPTKCLDRAPKEDVD